jgi:hypothetical protein
VATFPVTSNFGVGLHLAGPVTIGVETDFFVQFGDVLPANWHAQGVLAAGWRLQPRLVVGWGITAAPALGLRQAQIPQWQLAGEIDDVIMLQDGLLPRGAYIRLLADRPQIHDAFAFALPRSIHEGIGLHDVRVVARALIVLDGLELFGAPGATGNYHLTIAQFLRLNGLLSRFLGGSVAEQIHLHAADAYRFVAQPVLAAGLGIHLSETHRLIFRLVADEGVALGDAEFLRQLFNGQLADGVEITGAQLDPSGDFTTWVINTRTGATTEYRDWAFNSFARIDAHKYLGANASGLYELAGDTDAGAQVIADIQSGLLQFSGSHLSSLKAAYLGMRGGGEFYLKLVTDGLSVVYRIAAHDMKTTRVNLGKGLRARYFSYELTSSGQNFDLDSIEFLPIMQQRRI